MNCVLVDSDMCSVQMVQDNLNNNGYCKNLLTFTNPNDFLDVAESISFDLLLLDIVTSELGSISLATKFPNKFIVFIIGEEAKLKDAVKFCPLGIICKPVNRTNLNKVLLIAHQLINVNKNTVGGKLFNSINPSGKVIVKPEEIIYVKTQYENHRNKLIILKDGTKYLLSNISFEEILSMSKELVRVNKSELISLNQIKSIEKDTIKLAHGSLDCLPKQVYLNRWFRNDFLTRFQ